MLTAELERSAPPLQASVTSVAQVAHLLNTQMMELVLSHESDREYNDSSDDARDRGGSHGGHHSTEEHESQSGPDQNRRDSLDRRGESSITSDEAPTGEDDLFTDDPENARILQRQVSLARFSGPLPDPHTLAGYGNISRDFPDRIVSMTEAEVYSKTNAVRKLSSAEAYAVRTGATTVLLVSILGLSAAVVLIVLGYPVAALAAALPAILQGVASFVNALRSTKDREETSDNERSPLLEDE